MKTLQVIENYCRLYKVDSPDISTQEKQFFVTISPAGSNVFYLHNSPKLLGQIIGSAMKRGTVLYVRYKKVTPVTWENWKWFWNRFFAPKVRDCAPKPNYSRPYKSEIFEDAQQRNLRKKPQKHGFISTFIANESMNLLQPGLIPGIKI